MARRMKRAQRQTVLAAIARREWLLQMLALGAASCGRGGDRAYTRGNTLVMGIRDVKELEYDDFRYPGCVLAPPGSGG